MELTKKGAKLLEVLGAICDIVDGAKQDPPEWVDTELGIYFNEQDLADLIEGLQECYGDAVNAQHLTLDMSTRECADFIASFL